MRVLPDTSVWTAALSRRAQARAPKARRLRHLIVTGHEVFLTGLVLQEVLQGIRSDDTLEQVVSELSLLDLLEPTMADHVEAAALHRRCREAGVAASTVDVLIATLAVGHDCWLLTEDQDFTLIAAHCGLRLLD